MHLISLLRIKQWYKNAIIFVAIIFSLNLFNTSYLLKFILGFFSLCFVSSSSYIINDIVDRREDRLHPEKKTRPIASGAIRIPTALILSVLLFLLSLYLASRISLLFLTAILALFLSSQLYTFFFKHEIFLDAINIAINFVIRAASGIFIITTHISPWNILTAFFLALMITFGKRKAELYHLRATAGKHRKVLIDYQATPLDSFIFICASFILISYAIYSIFEGRELLVLTVPITFYALMRYVNLTFRHSPIARHPELVFTDRKMLMSMTLWIILVISILYFV